MKIKIQIILNNESFYATLEDDAITNIEHAVNIFQKMLNESSVLSIPLDSNRSEFIVFGREALNNATFIFREAGS